MSQFQDRTSPALGPTLGRLAIDLLRLFGAVVLMMSLYRGIVFTATNSTALVAFEKTLVASAANWMTTWKSQP